MGARERRKLVSGFGALRDRSMGRFDELRPVPSHWAISLSGEPTIYPRLGLLIRKLKENPEVKTVFLVTNGQEPERIAQLAEDDSLPTQLYISFAASDESVFKRITGA